MTYVIIVNLTIAAMYLALLLFLLHVLVSWHAAKVTYGDVARKTALLKRQMRVSYVAISSVVLAAALEVTSGITYDGTSTRGGAESITEAYLVALVVLGFGSIQVLMWYLAAEGLSDIRKSQAERKEGLRSN